MARVLSVPRLLVALVPELNVRWQAAALDFTFDIVFHTDIGDATLQIQDKMVTAREGSSTDPAALVISLPQSDLARLVLGAFPAGDILARLPESYAGQRGDLTMLILLTLFPERHAHMHLPDRY